MLNIPSSKIKVKVKNLPYNVYGKFILLFKGWLLYMAIKHFLIVYCGLMLCLGSQTPLPKFNKKRAFS